MGPAAVTSVGLKMDACLDMNALACSSSPQYASHPIVAAQMEALCLAAGLIMRLNEQTNNVRR